MSYRSSRLVSAKMLRMSSSMISTVFLSSTGSFFLDPVQEQSGFVEQPVERADILDDDRFGQTPQFGLFLRAEILAGIDNDRHVADLGLDPFHQIESVHVRKAEIEYNAVVMLVAELRHRFFSGPDRDGFHIAFADEFDDALLGNPVVFNHEQT